MPCCDPYAALSLSLVATGLGCASALQSWDSAGATVTATSSASLSRGELQQSASIPRMDLGVFEGHMLVRKLFLAPSCAAQQKAVATNH